MQASYEEKNVNKEQAEAEQVSDKILTIPNLISFMRLLLIPVFFILLTAGQDMWATFVFALAACTDWVDGQVARKTGTVSKLGQLLDPAVDRLLMISGVLGLLFVGRLPLWIVLFIIARDGLVLLGGAYLLKRHHIRIPVIYAGKIATACLLFGFAGLLLNWPLVAGLGITSLPGLPGFTAEMVSWGIWPVYVGLAFSLCTALYYLIAAIKALRAHKGSGETTSL